MNGFVRLPVLYPVSVVFPDDNADFLNALQGIFPGESLNQFFVSARAALGFMSSCHRRTSSRDLSGPDYAAVEKNAGNALGHDLLTDDRRFEEIAAVVVGHEMPEVNGLEFLASLGDIGSTRILLTGQAGETQTIDTFNAGLIDFYLKKSDATMTRKLATVLSDAKKRHCAQKDPVSIHDAGATYRDLRTRAAHRILPAPRTGCRADI